MHSGQLVFAQLMAHLPLTTFRRCVARYDGNHKVKSFSCMDQFLVLAFAQLTYRESLRGLFCTRVSQKGMTAADKSIQIQAPKPQMKEFGAIEGQVLLFAH